MAIVDHVIALGTPPSVANTICGGVTTLNSVSTATGQSTAVLLGSGAGNIAICSASGRAFQLPSCGINSEVYIFNSTSNTASIYGQTGEILGAGTANSAFALATKKGCSFKKVTATQWGVNLSA